MGNRKLFSGLLALLLTISFSGANAVVLKIATLAPDGTTWMKEMRKAAAEINQETEGRVKLKFYPGGVMGGDETVLRKMRVGQLHGGAFVSGSLISISPDIQLYGLPLVFENLDQVEYVRDRMDRQLAQGLEDKGYAVLGLSGGGFAYLMSDEVLTAAPELRKKKVWVPDTDLMSLAVFKSAGVNAIQLPLSDVYTSLQTGLIDTVETTFVGAIAFQWHTRVKAVLNMPLSYLFGILMVDGKRFSRISESDQAIVRRIVGEAFALLDDLNVKDNAAARKTLEKRGIKFTNPSDSDRHHWVGIARATINGLAGTGQYTTAAYQQMLDLIASYDAREQ